jgi:hypothetical protein
MTSTRPVDPAAASFQGNALFEHAVVSTGLDASLARILLAGALAIACNARPTTLTLEQLARSLPEISKRFGLLVSELVAVHAVRRIHHEVLAPRLSGEVLC